MAEKLITFQLTGVVEMRRKFERLVREFPEAVGSALHEELEIELLEAKQRTPVDTGALRASGFVEGPKVRRGHISDRIVFGGPAAPYAVIVHEDLEAHHPVGQAKFLESVLVESAPYLLERTVDRAFRKLA